MVDSAQVAIMCKSSDQMASLVHPCTTTRHVPRSKHRNLKPVPQAVVLEREAATLLGERFPHAPQPSYEVVDVVLDPDLEPSGREPGPPLAIKALESGYSEMFQAKGGGKGGLRVVVDMGYHPGATLPIDQQWKIQEVGKHFEATTTT